MHTTPYTPVERHDAYYVKRDDLYEYAGQHGGKVRTCRHLATRVTEQYPVPGEPGLITAGSRHSPQVEIVSAIARHLGVPCRVHVPAGPDTPQIEAALRNGAEVQRWRPGYNSVIEARSRADAVASGWRFIPFGMQTPEAVLQTAGQVGSLDEVPYRRLVVPVGSAMTLCGLLRGFERGEAEWPEKIIGVVVGADPVRRLDTFAPLWRFLGGTLSLLPADVPYSAHVKAQVGDLLLDPVYEAKCLPFLEPDDLLWVVGIRGEGRQA